MRTKVEIALLLLAASAFWLLAALLIGSLGGVPYN